MHNHDNGTIMFTNIFFNSFYIPGVFYFIMHNNIMLKQTKLTVTADEMY